MAKKTEAQKEKARQYSRDWYARQQREKREAAADAKSADPIKAAAKRLSKWADEELSIRLSPKHENKAAKAATALTVAGNMGPLREVLDQLRETTETMKGAGLQFGCFTWPDGTALTVRNNGEVIITFGDVQ